MLVLWLLVVPFNIIFNLHRGKGTQINPVSSSYPRVPEFTVRNSAHGVLMNRNRAIETSGGHVPCSRHREVNHVTDTNRSVLCCLLVVFCRVAPEGCD
jgi:hypothetical protein